MGSGAAPQNRVRAWFGEHLVADQRAEPALAQRYAELMSTRFPGLRITNEPIVTPTAQVQVPDLPSDPRLWPMTVHFSAR